LPLTQPRHLARYLVASGALQPQNNYGGGGATKAAAAIAAGR